MTNLKNKKAFSLIELSIVILIIGIIIAGVTQSSRLVRQFKLSSARSQTQSGPVSSIKDLVAWYETSSEDSFLDAETEDSAITGGSYVTSWHDINTASSIKHNAEYSTTAGTTTAPFYYANCMSGLPCLRFDGSNDALYFDGSFLAGVDYTIFVVEQRRDAAALFFLGSGAVSAGGNTLVEIGYTGTSTITFGQGDTSNYYKVGTTPSIPAYATPSPRLHCFVNSTIAHGGVATFAHYMNGATTASSFTTVGSGITGNLSAYNQASIGTNLSSGSSAYFNGDIGEIIFFARALKAEERDSVEAYLLKKWSIAGI